MKVGSATNVLKMRMDVSKGQTIEEKVLFIFNALSITKGEDSLVPRCFRNRPMPGFTRKLIIKLVLIFAMFIFLLSTSKDNSNKQE